MAIYGPHGSEIKAPNKVDGKLSDNQKTAIPNKPKKPKKLSQSGKSVGDQQSKKGRGRPRLLIMEPVILDVFRNLFPTKPNILDQIKKNMKEKGFLKSLPIIVGKGPWTEGPFIVDGHTRHDAAKSLGIQPIYDTNIRYFETELEALKFAIYLQKVRRNITDADILSCIEAVDKVKSPGRPIKELASSDANLDSDSFDNGGTEPSLLNENKGKSAKETADIVGTSISKVERSRVVLAVDTPSKLKQEVLSGEKSIYSASNEAKALRKAKTTPPVTTPLPVSAAPTVEIQSDNNDVAAEKGPSIQAIREMITKSESLNPEYNADKILEAGVYFRKFDTTWGPAINLAEALPASDLDKVVTRFNNLVARIKAKSDNSAKCAAEVADKNQTLPGIDSKAPITDEVKGNNDTSQNVSRLVTWLDTPRNRKQAKTNGPEINN